MLAFGIFIWYLESSSNLGGEIQLFATIGNLCYQFEIEMYQNSKLTQILMCGLL